MGELQYIEAEIKGADGDRDWIVAWAKLGIQALEASLEKHQAFNEYLDEQESSAALPDPDQLEVG